MTHMTKNSACLFAAFAIFSTIAVDDAMADAAGMTPPTASKVQNEFSRLIQEARNAGNAGKFEEFGELLEKAKKLDPKSPAPFRLEATAHANWGDWPALRNTLAEYFKRGGILDGRVLQLSAMLDFQDEKYSESIEKITRAIESGEDKENDAPNRKFRIKILLETKRFAEVKEELEWFSKRDDLTLQHAFLSAALAECEGNDRKALEILEKALGAERRPPEAADLTTDWLEATKHCAIMNNWFRNFSRSVQLCDSYISKYPYDLQIYPIRGKAFEEMGEHGKAIRDYLTATTSYAPIPESLRKPRKKSLEAIEQLLILGKSNPDAERAFVERWNRVDSENFFDGSPDLPLAKIFLRHYQIERNEAFRFNATSRDSIDRSLKDLDEIATILPSTKATNTLRQRLIKAKEKGPSTELDSALLDILCEKDNGLSGEIMVFLSHFQIIANFGDISKKRNFTAKETRQIQNAERLLTVAAEKNDPNSARALFLLARLAHSRGDMETAMRHVRKSNTMEKEYFDALVLESEILRDQGKLPELEELYRKILQSFPNEKKIQERLSELRNLPGKTPTQEKRGN